VETIVKRQTRRQAGFSLIELLIVIAIILIILAIALPRLGRARMYAQEMAAMKTITTIHTAETQYFSQFGKFADTLTELGPPASGAAGPSAADLIPGGLAQTGEGSGYKYILAITATGYTINANPTIFGTTGGRTFFSDQTMTIHQHSGQEPASVTDPEIK
jgi:prepilin-type N-terminal cleavage/methylation domain-containing protein